MFKSNLNSKITVTMHTPIKHSHIHQVLKKEINRYLKMKTVENNTRKSLLFVYRKVEKKTKKLWR